MGGCARRCCQRFTGKLDLYHLADWFWDSGFAVSISYLGTRGLCHGPDADGDVACRSVEKNRALRLDSNCGADVTKRGGSLADIVFAVVGRQHSLRRLRDNGPDTVRSDAGEFQRDGTRVTFFLGSRR